MPHARLCGVERKCEVISNPNANLDLIVEKEALELAFEISKYPQVLLHAADALQPGILIAYLFELSHAISVCHNTIYVKNVEHSIAEARLLLYSSTKQTFLME